MGRRDSEKGRQGSGGITTAEGPQASGFCIVEAITCTVSVLYPLSENRAVYLQGGTQRGRWGCLNYYTFYAGCCSYRSVKFHHSTLFHFIPALLTPPPYITANATSNLPRFLSPDRFGGYQNTPETTRSCLLCVTESRRSREYPSDH